jgi:hypothetical protein
MLATLPNALSQQNIAAGEATRRRVLSALQRATPARYDERRPKGTRLVHALQTTTHIGSAYPSSPTHFPGIIFPGDV